MYIVVWAAFQILGKSRILLLLGVKPEFISNNISVTLVIERNLEKAAEPQACCCLALLITNIGTMLGDSPGQRHMERHTTEVTLNYRHACSMVHL